MSSFLLSPWRRLRAAAGAALRHFGGYAAYERLLFRLRFPRPQTWEWNRRRVRLWVDSDSTRRFLDVFARNEGALMQCLADHLPPGGTAWDAGANKGVFSLLLGRQAGPDGRVIAFEPEAYVFGLLQRNLRADGAGNVTAMQVALGRENGQATLRLAGAGEHTLQAGAPAARTQTVELARGDALVARGVPLPQVLKLDVEGAELDVLEGMGALLDDPGLRCLAIELHPEALAPAHPDALAALRAHLEPRGWVLSAVLPRGTELHCLCTRPALPPL